MKPKSGHFTVAIFGSARIREADPLYKQVYELARLIAADDMNVVTGGGPGLMEAANKGLQDGRLGNGTLSFGLNIRLARKQKYNLHLDIKREFERFSSRLDAFMDLADAVVVAPGGVGTLLEFLYTLQLTQVREIGDIPIILIGDMWADFMAWLEKWPLRNNLISQKDIENVFPACGVEEAMLILRRARAGGPLGRRYSCRALRESLRTASVSRKSMPEHPEE
jgi:uncharacterized protein (TIGR00730 family)